MTAGHRHVGFAQAIALFFKNYVNFKDRSSRGAYWWWSLVSLVVACALVLVDWKAVDAGMTFMQAMMNGNLPSNIFALVTFLPALSLSVRRLHDIGKTGWWLVFLMIPTFIATVVATVVFATAVAAAQTSLTPVAMGPVAGAFGFAGLVSVVCMVILIIWAAKPGQRATNRFGPDVEAGK